MANAVETSPFSSSSSFNFPINEKPLVLRVKRKASQSRFEAFWLEINEKPLKQTLSDFGRLSISDSTGKGLEIIDGPLKQTLSDFRKLSISDLTGKGLEINERPLKRPLLDFGKLSVSDTTGKGLEINERPLKRPLLDFGKLSISDLTGKEMKTERVFMQHVETVSSFEATINVLQSFMSNYPNASEFRTMIEEGRKNLKKDNDLAVDPSSNGHVNQARDECNHSLVLRDDLGYVCCICGVIERGIETICDFQYIEEREREKEKRRRKKKCHSRTSRRLHRFRHAATRGPGARTVRTYMFDSQNTEDRVVTEAYHNPESLAKIARFEQIRRRRKGKEEVIYGESLHEKCHIYDIVRVDIEETSNDMEELKYNMLPSSNVVEEQECRNISLEDKELLCGFLSLIREFIPSAAAEIESDLCASSKQASKNEYVYDVYTMKDNLNAPGEDALDLYPLVQVDDDDDDDFNDGPIQFEFESGDLNELATQ